MTKLTFFDWQPGMPIVGWEHLGDTRESFFFEQWIKSERENAELRAEIRDLQLQLPKDQPATQEAAPDKKKKRRHLDKHLAGYWGPASESVDNFGLALPDGIEVCEVEDGVVSHLTKND